MAKDHVVNINKGLALDPKRIGGSGSPSKIYPGDTITWKSHVDVTCWVTDFNPPDIIKPATIQIDVNKPTTIQIDVNGQGTLLTTEECLLSTEQERNRGIPLQAVY